jgi:hypothetical protein
MIQPSEVMKAEFATGNIPENKFCYVVIYNNEKYASVYTGDLLRCLHHYLYMIVDGVVETYEQEHNGNRFTGIWRK